jgi:hypothetical protein
LARLSSPDLASGGISRSSALAVERLITNSNLVDCTTGRSAGVAPLRNTTRIDAEFGITMDVEERFEIKPAYLAADTAYGSADALNWIVNEKKIAPHIPVLGRGGSAMVVGIARIAPGPFLQLGPGASSLKKPGVSPR